MEGLALKGQFTSKLSLSFFNHPQGVANRYDLFFYTEVMLQCIVLPVLKMNAMFSKGVHQAIANST